MSPGCPLPPCSPACAKQPALIRLQWDTLSLNFCLLEAQSNDSHHCFQADIYKHSPIHSKSIRWALIGKSINFPPRLKSLHQTLLPSPKLSQTLTKWNIKGGGTGGKCNEGISLPSEQSLHHTPPGSTRAYRDPRNVKCSQLYFGPTWNLSGSEKAEQNNKFGYTRDRTSDHLNTLMCTQTSGMQMLGFLTCQLAQSRWVWRRIPKLLHIRTEIPRGARHTDFPP